jgi:hypothetical protein
MRVLMSYFEVDCRCQRFCRILVGALYISYKSRCSIDQLMSSNVFRCSKSLISVESRTSRFNEFTIYPYVLRDYIRVDISMLSR